MRRSYSTLAGIAIELIEALEAAVSGKMVWTEICNCGWRDITKQISGSGVTIVFKRWWVCINNSYHK